MHTGCRIPKSPHCREPSEGPPRCCRTRSISATRRGQGSWGCSARHGSGLPALGSPAWAGGWSRWCTEASSNLSRSVVLWVLNFSLFLSPQLSCNTFGYFLGHIITIFFFFLLFDSSYWTLRSRLLLLPLATIHYLWMISFYFLMFFLCSASFDFSLFLPHCPQLLTTL